MCIDYYPLNSIMERDSHPLPRKSYEGLIRNTIKIWDIRDFWRLSMLSIVCSISSRQLSELSNILTHVRNVFCHFFKASIARDFFMVSNTVNYRFTLCTLTISVHSRKQEKITNIFSFTRVSKLFPVKTMNSTKAIRYLRIYLEHYEQDQVLPNCEYAMK